MAPVLSSSIVCLVAAWSALAPVEGIRPDDGDPLRYRFFKDVIPVASSNDRVFVRSATPAALEARLALHGAVVDPQGFAAPGWVAAKRVGQVEGPSLAESLRAEPTALFVTPVFVDEAGARRAATPELVVRFVEGTTDDAARAALAGVGRILDADAFGMTRAYLVDTGLRDGSDVLRLADRLADLENVRFAEPISFLDGAPDDVPNDPLFDSSWNVRNIGQPPSFCGSTSGGLADIDVDGPEAWALASGAPNVIVVVIDNGMQFDHPDLLADPALGFDPTGQNGGGWPVQPCDNHGTAVAGCIAALRDNGIGVAGIASGVSLASARISIASNLCAPWTVQSGWVASALEWSVSIGARITNTSWTFTTSSIVADAYQTSADAGLLHFASSGNNASTSINFPANLPSVVANGSLTRFGVLASSSNSGADQELVAPGATIVCPDRTGAAGYTSGDFTCISGTSFASPTSAGVAALMLSVNPALTGQQVRVLLRTATVDLGAPGWDPTFGWGLPKAPKAIARAERPADLDGDGVVGSKDLAVLLGGWGGGGPLGDLDGDGTISGSDLAILLGDW
jgi:subtilisin family serine protease